MPPMQRNRPKQAPQTRTLRPQDLASVRGGTNGVINMDAIVGGGVARDNGVIQLK